MTEGEDRGTTVPERTAVPRGSTVAALLLSETRASPLKERTQRSSVLKIPSPPAALRIGRGTGGADDDPAYAGLQDPSLSRNHLRVVAKQGVCRVTDEGSLNGTYLDGRRLTAKEPAELSDGSILSFGRHAAVFRRIASRALSALALDAESPFGPVPTLSPGLAVELATLKRLAPSNSEVLFLGETGVGKEIYARALHRTSGRTGAFIAINCAAIPIELAESELFGCARGAHSTATDGKAGLIHTAVGGTLFLDEIGEASPNLQAKLLRFLQDKEVRPVGATRGQRVDVRVVAATNQLENGPLRADLVARLGAEPLTIPPLRNRVEDIGPLVSLFVGKSDVVFEAEALRALFLYGWPRNVRELESVVRRALLLAVDGRVTLEQLPLAVREALTGGPPISALSRRRPAPSRADLKALLAAHDGNVAAVARALGRRWNVVWRWMAKHELKGNPNEGGGESPVSEDRPARLSGRA